MKHIHKCPKCEIYTLKEVCPICGEKTIIPKPAKYSPEDKFGEYRLKAKIAMLKEKGILK